MANIKHMHSSAGGRKKQSKTYQAWADARRRCNNPNYRLYHRYGGRGITFAPEWDRFTAFLSDMGEAPKGTTLDRINNDKGYEPGNCRWATWKEQQRNRSSNVLLEFNGKTQCISEWGEETGICRKRIEQRIKRGWSIERALTTTTA